MDNELLTILESMIRIDTTNPPGNEIELEKIIIPFLEKSKIEYSIHRSAKTRSNIIAEIGKKDSKTLLISCHMDVVPAGDGWDTEPFEPVIKDGRIYGRGTMDNKGQLAAVLIAMKNLKKTEETLNSRVIFAIVADEECGSEHGMAFLMKNNLIKADYAIIPDTAGNMETIVIGEKGNLGLEYTFIGRQAHGSTPEEGINAIHLASDFIQKIKDYTLKHTHNPDFEGPTINIGLINGGSAFNMVAGKCTITLDIRTIPNQTPESIKKELDLIAESCGNFRSVITMTHDPMLVDINSPLIKAIQKSAQKINSRPAKTITIGGGTVSKELVKRGICSVGFSCGDHDMFHIANESIDIAELEQFSKVIEEIVHDLK